LKLRLAEHFSTAAAGIAKWLGLQSETKSVLETIIRQIESRLSDQTRIGLLCIRLGFLCYRERKSPMITYTRLADETPKTLPALTGVTKPVFDRLLRAFAAGDWQRIQALPQSWCSRLAAQ
jgi:hypothetical protein